MSRHSYLQEQLLYQPQHPVNLKRLRQQAAALPIYARSYSLEEQQLAQAQAQAQFVPVYNKFIYPHESLNPIYTHDSLNSLSSDYTDYDYETSAGFIVEQAVPPPVASTNVVQNLNALGRLLELLQRLPLPCLSFNTACICSLIMIFIAPRSCAQTLLFPAFRLFFGTLYPAYASYKAVRTKNVKEYVKWMMYWIVFAFFTCIETFTDIFLAWFPFYYEIKVVIVLWLLSPATKGSSTLYRKFVHPMLTRREQEIDEYLNQARERGYSAVLQLGSKGVNYATNVIMQTAIKGGGNLVQTIKRSYSLSDLSEPDMHRTQDELDEVMASSTVMLRPQPTRLMRQRHQTPVGRSASGTRHSTGMYFTEVDVAGAGKQSGDFNYNIRSTDDISSGYSSAEPVSAPLGNVGVGLSRTSSMTNASKARVKSKRSEQLLEDMRAEVYLENERYFQACRAEMLRQQMPLKIDESEQEQLDSNDDNEFDDDDEDEEQTFYEALASKDSSLEPEQKVEQLSDNEDSFKEALTTASTELTLKEEHVEEAATEDAPKAEQIEEQAAAAKEQELEEKADFNALTATMDPFLLVMTETRPAARPVSPRQLLATLEDIQHSFRAQLQPEMPLPRPKAQHSKGPAPPPPLPPKKERRTPERSAQQTERSRSSGIGQLFKSFKDNVRRGSSSSKDEQLPTTAAKETPI